MKKLKELLRHLYYIYIRIPLVYRQFRHLKIANSMDTIDYIIKNKCSVSRYGDGEFTVMKGGDMGFQFYNMNLAERLEEVLKSDVPNHIVCLSYFMKDRQNLVPFVRNFWGFYVAMNRDFLLRHLSFEKQYYDTQISRFYHAYKNKSNCEKHLNCLRMIWDNRDVLIVEGEETRSGVGNNLYSNSKTLKRILCPSENAYNSYERIFDKIKKESSHDTLILLALGMTATVLAYDLAKEGLQAVDIGHLDIEYEWMKMGVTTRVPVKGKYVNEAKEDTIPECNDPDYLKSIIAIVK